AVILVDQRTADRAGGRADRRALGHVGIGHRADPGAERAAGERALPGIVAGAAAERERSGEDRGQYQPTHVSNSVSVLHMSANGGARGRFRTLRPADAAPGPLVAAQASRASWRRRPSP